MSNDTLGDEIEERGFAILPHVISPETIAEVSDEISQPDPRRSRAGVRHAMHLASVARIASSSELMALARNVLEPQAFPLRATIFDKSPDANWLVVRHQDTALPLRHRLDVPGWRPWSTKEGIPYAHATRRGLVAGLGIENSPGQLDRRPWPTEGVTRNSQARRTGG